MDRNHHAAAVTIGVAENCQKGAAKDRETKR